MPATTCWLRRKYPTGAQPISLRQLDAYERTGRLAEPIRENSVQRMIVELSALEHHRSVETTCWRYPRLLRFGNCYPLPSLAPLRRGRLAIEFRARGRTKASATFESRSNRGPSEGLSRQPRFGRRKQR